MYKFFDGVYYYLTGDTEKAEKLIHRASRVMAGLEAENTNNLEQLLRKMHFDDGSYFRVSSIFGHKKIHIHVPPEEEELEVWKYRLVAAIEAYDSQGLPIGYVLCLGEGFEGPYRFIRTNNVQWWYYPYMMHPGYEHNEQANVYPFWWGQWEYWDDDRPYDGELGLQLVYESDEERIIDIPCNAEELVESDWESSRTNNNQWGGAAYVVGPCIRIETTEDASCPGGVSSSCNYVGYAAKPVTVDKSGDGTSYITINESEISSTHMEYDYTRTGSFPTPERFGCSGSVIGTCEAYCDDCEDDWEEFESDPESCFTTIDPEDLLFLYDSAGPGSVSETWSGSWGWLSYAESQGVGYDVSRYGVWYYRGVFYGTQTSDQAASTACYVYEQGYNDIDHDWEYYEPVVQGKRYENNQIVVSVNNHEWILAEYPDKTYEDNPYSRYTWETFVRYYDVSEGISLMSITIGTSAEEPMFQYIYADPKRDTMFHTEFDLETYREATSYGTTTTARHEISNLTYNGDPIYGKGHFRLMHYFYKE